MSHIFQRIKQFCLNNYFKTYVAVIIPYYMFTCSTNMLMPLKKHENNCNNPLNNEKIKAIMSDALINDFHIPIIMSIIWPIDIMLSLCVGCTAKYYYYCRDR